MSLETFKDIVGIVSVIITIILNLKQLISGSSSTPKPTNIMFNLTVAFGVLLVIYGGFRFNSVYADTSSERKACLRSYSFEAVDGCRDRIDAQYNEHVKPALGYIGAGAIAVALGFLVRNFKTASWIEYVIEFGLLILGILLIIPNF